MATTAVLPPHKDERPLVLGVTTVATVICTICFALRAWQRTELKVKFGVDDGLITVSFLMMWAIYAVFACHVIYGGLGDDLVALYLNDPQKLSEFIKFVYAEKLAIPIVLTVIKCSILAMYVRFFPTRFMKVSCSAVGVFIVIFGFAVFFPSVFVCTPIEKNWNPRAEGTCNQAADDWTAWQDGIPEFVTAIVLFALPVYEVWCLSSSFRNKVAISAVFLVGSLSVIASVVRFVIAYRQHATLARDRSSSQGMFNMNGARMVAQLMTWVHVEICAGFIANCLPSLRPLAVLVLQAFGLVKKTEYHGERRKSLLTFGRTGAQHPANSRDYFARLEAGGDTTLTARTFTEIKASKFSNSSGEAIDRIEPVFPGGSPLDGDGQAYELRQGPWTGARGVTETAVVQQCVSVSLAGDLPADSGENIIRCCCGGAPHHKQC
ncbi:hypothetical protein MFIFM68171_02080 [Madurella fahalii]|uniref:Rhodopsin domain-containing protein n=1 Tax=Madurella fahalii TaxID=1157608 RepID=A0ABQ0G285_9PEZI